jgi:DUF1365 family protein
MESAVYQGLVRHRRFAPRSHAFRYRLFMLYLDLDELETVFRDRWLWSIERANLASFRRSDYLDRGTAPLADAARSLASEHVGRRLTGPVRMLSHLRYLGYSFNPVTFYYCFNTSGAALEAVIAEITNTPWNERHCYVIDALAEGSRERCARGSFDKAFHVSPFMPMDHRYDWRFSAPGRKLGVHMVNRHRGETVFDASLTMRRRPLSGPVLARMLATHLPMTWLVIGAIYWQALRLRLKKIPFHPHPRTDGAVRESYR